ncbi:DUF2236 domain-containing protein [Rhodococcus erythropolis]|uniref:oxygenase MpaB family protein n=1 Tax=Rhodococcus erythropolis TaxID=1833 RepID=UPI00210D3A51|nr:oxygenase MpaB family protein [Rhodococcus erythropolis]MCQ4129236.1 DUF2236 domain-containing protein [Rhodococcus erythropolis]
MTWKVWGYPSSLTVGFQRAVVIEELDPFLVAPVDTTGKIFAKPRARYDNTLRYFAIAAFADSQTATTAAQMLMRIHSNIVGLEPVSGRPYNANDPAQQLWIHLTAWHSILYAYERYGPGRLSEGEEAQYWYECSVAAQLQTCDPADVPRTREGIRLYFEAMRPRLAASEATQGAMHQLLDASVMFPQLPVLLRPGARLVSGVIRAATIATMPRWQRDLAALRQSTLVGALIRPLLKVAFATVVRVPQLEVALINWISPATYPIVRPMLLSIPAMNPRTTTPAQAFRDNNIPTPVTMFADMQLQRAGHPVPDLAPSVPMPQPSKSYRRRAEKQATAI